MRIRALSVFEGVVYHCWPIDRSNPERPTLEVEALLREGDADQGPLLLPVPDFITMAGGLDAARPALDAFRAKGRIVDHLGVPHLTFPLWTRVPDALGDHGTPETPVAGDAEGDVSDRGPG